MSNGNVTTASTPQSSLTSQAWRFAVAFCAATLLAELIMLGLAWQRGWLSEGRLQRAKEAFYGVKRREIRTRLASVKSPDGVSAKDQRLRDRAMRISDMPVRTGVARRDSIEGNVERNTLRIEQSRYEQTRVGFDKALDDDIKKLENNAIDALQGLMEQLPPRVAKEHLMLMLTAPVDNDPKQALNDAVSVMRRLSPDRRRKVFSEFQSPEEAAQVEAMLRRIREIEAQPSSTPNSAPSGAGPGTATPGAADPSKAAGGQPP